MKREEAKQKLIDLGIAEPTEEQISSLLDSVTAETKSEKARADKYKEDASKAADLQKQLDDLQSQNLSDAEKAQKENELYRKLDRTCWEIAKVLKCGSYQVMQWLKGIAIHKDRFGKFVECSDTFGLNYLEIA